MSEREVLNEGGVLVTTKRFVASGTTYQLRTITSVRRKPAPSRLPAVFLFAIGAIGSFGVARDGSAVFVLLGLFFVALSVGSLFTEGKAELYVTTSARELRALRGPPKLIAAAEQALNQAMAEAE
ncbi:MAG: hypothetical protein J0L92_03465 [Deltaproteobacteria bacterium]|nr:hypothetical protein [Deltaproteobacteria bacterium]